MTPLTAIITGTSSGLGRCIALRYATTGARILCVDLSEHPGGLETALEAVDSTEVLPTAEAVDSAAAVASAAERGAQERGEPDEDRTPTHELIKQRGGSSELVRADVGDPGGWESIMAALSAWGGRVDVLINNAAISLESTNPTRIHETHPGQYDETMRVNARSVFLGCRCVIARMLGQDVRDEGGRGTRGAIVNIASIYGVVADRVVSSYAASKGAVVQLTKQIALDYAGDGIRVNAVAPGYIQTPMFTRTLAGNPGSAQRLHAKHPLHGAGYPEDVAGMVVVLAGEEARWVTGSVVSVDGGYVAQ